MLRLAMAAPADIPFIMRAERLPGYQDRVGRWSEEEHRQAMASASHAYFIGYQDAAPVGFSMIQDRQDLYGNLLFRRLAVATPGQGHGRFLFTATVDWVFRETAAHRLWLVVYRENAAAYHLYRSEGFVEEGAARECRVLSDGRRVDGVFLSVLRREWNARTTSGDRAA